MPAPWIALLAMCGLLGALAAWQILWPVSADVPAVAAKSAMIGAPPPAAGIAAPLPPRDTYAEIEHRPLFVSGRKPLAVMEARKPSVGPSNLDKYTVLGIVAASAGAEAVLRAPGGEALHLRPGQSVEGWTLDAIQPRKLIFTSAGTRRELELTAAESNKTRCRPGPTMVSC